MAGAEAEEAPLPFHYAAGIAPMLWAMVAISAIEMFVVHLVIALVWRGAVALVLSLLTGATIVWIVLLIRSLPRLPVLVGPEEMLLRIGTLKAVTVPRSAIAAVRTDWPPDLLKRRGVLNLALLAHPNVVVDLREEMVVRKRRVAHIAHRLDDPGRFVAALAGA